MKKVAKKFDFSIDSKHLHLVGIVEIVDFPFIQGKLKVSWLIKVCANLAIVYSRSQALGLISCHDNNKKCFLQIRLWYYINHTILLLH